LPEAHRPLKTVQSTTDRVSFTVYDACCVMINIHIATAQAMSPTTTAENISGPQGQADSSTAHV
jgi:hypothetical protein